ncbi:MAG: hypothetical protein GEV08_08850 [Acidimicrobiia bacterium]|nr:hypothetical protein [Acidimicrobiia bacterium]
MAARLSLRDRLLSPRVARAMTSPLGIVLAGVGAAAGIITGLGPIGAVAGAALAWGGRVAAAIPPAPAGPDIEPRALGEPWRAFVTRALANRGRFHQAVREARDGPLTERLGQIGVRIDAGVEESWQVAQRAHSLTQARRQVDKAAIEGQLAEARRALGDPNLPPTMAPTYERTVESLQAQLASARRMEQVITQANAELGLLDARLGEAVTRAIELGARAGDVGELGELGDDVESLVREMEALRQALEEVGPVARGGAAG